MRNNRVKRVKGLPYLALLMLIGILISGAGCVSSPNLGYFNLVSGMDSALNEQLNPDTPEIIPPATIELVNKVKSSVVTIEAEIETMDMQGYTFTGEVSGSGLILDEDGLIVTNNHVVQGAKNATVILANGETYVSKTIRTDPIDDLAVIDIGIPNLPAVTMGDSAKLKVGDCVVAIGNPWAEGMKATQGLITSTEATFRVGTRETLYNTLETSVPITYGNSGGPLFNMEGEVIGITTGAIMTRTGMQLSGYAISSNTAAQVIQQLTQNGYVTRPWLGVNASSVSDLQGTGYTLPVSNGAYIIQVSAGSPAEAAGVKAGDVISGFDGKAITNAEDLVKAVRDSKIGQAAEIDYYDHSGLYAPTVQTVTLAQFTTY